MYPQDMGIPGICDTDLVSHQGPERSLDLVSIPMCW